MPVFVSEKREVEILKGLASGLRVKEIADQTGLSVRTIESYLVSIKTKYEAKTSTELMAIVFREKIIK